MHVNCMETGRLCACALFFGLAKDMPDAQCNLSNALLIYFHVQCDAAMAVKVAQLIAQNYRPVPCTRSPIGGTPCTTRLSPQLAKKIFAVAMGT